MPRFAFSTLSAAAAASALAIGAIVLPAQAAPMPGIAASGAVHGSTLVEKAKWHRKWRHIKRHGHWRKWRRHRR